VDYKKVDNGISIDFVMDPLASRFVVFRKNSAGKNNEGLSYDLQFGFTKDKVSETLQRSLDVHIRSLPKYAPIESPFID
jgi:hypothetical protein